ncbi:MAG: hypothetical protein ABSC41_13715 [Acidimicrobiales bacterium]
MSKNTIAIAQNHDRNWPGRRPAKNKSRAMTQKGAQTQIQHFDGAQPSPTFSQFTGHVVLGKRTPSVPDDLRIVAAGLRRPHWGTAIKPMQSAHFFATVILMKWLWVIVLVIVGILAALVAIEYLTISIHAIPSFMGRHPGRGHYRKRGALAALIAVIAFVAAGYLIYRTRRADKLALAAAGGGPAVASAAPAAELPPESAAVAPEPPAISSEQQVSSDKPTEE